ncbi:hypothetical protein M378DRAFT_171847 [Amanita muscaria Koide BX008]|uniref:Uncharacterized protein n=1 Tax=Amanita muscaria (strain Koide BX008) TaxID=946122 RepID=A0A0C2W848_AMAMK|nr:hypothetical protein M378DRAFT_171847 [Amanita muscaria Koide BX008]
MASTPLLLAVREHLCWTLNPWLRLQGGIHHMVSCWVLRSVKLNIVTHRAGYYINIPSLAWIPNYSSLFLAGDFLAGVTVSVRVASMLISLPLHGICTVGVTWDHHSSCHLNMAPEAALKI